MIFRPRQLGPASLEKEELTHDKKYCKRIGPCGIGKKALYLNSFYFDRVFYIPIASVERVFKRVAMSKGGFSGKGMFASIPYLVVEYDNGKQKQCNFKSEDQVDEFLRTIGSRYPDIPLHSVEAEKKLAEKQKALEAKMAKIESARAQKSIRNLENCRIFLERREGLANELSAAARRKRAYDQSNPAYKWVALFITLMGIASLIYGIYALLTHAGFSMYFLLFGLAAVFLFSSANVLPTANNNRKAVEKRLEKATEASGNYIKNYQGFPLPARYAHPMVCKRMIEILADDRATGISDALEVLKKDLKALNSSVEVEQEEYDEIVAIKPLFLVADYE